MEGDFICLGVFPPFSRMFTCPSPYELIIIFLPHALPISEQPVCLLVSSVDELLVILSFCNVDH